MSVKNISWRIILSVLFLVFSSSAFAYVGDGVCDDSDLLKQSMDCSASTYVLTSNGGPLQLIKIYESGANSAIVPLLLKNLDSTREAYVCFTTSGAITLFDKSGDVNALCYLIPEAGQMSVSIGLKYGESIRSDMKAGELLITTSHTSKTVEVYVVSKTMFDALSSPHLAVPFAIIVFVVVSLLINTLS